MRRFIARSGDDGQCGVWDAAQEDWSIPPSRDACEATRIADSMEQAHLEALAAMTGLFSEIVPLCFSVPLCPRLSWMVLHATYRN